MAHRPLTLLGCHSSAYEKTSCCSSVCLQTSSCLESLRFLRLQKESWRKQRHATGLGKSSPAKAKNELQVLARRAPDAHRAVPNSFLAKRHYEVRDTSLYSSLLEPRKLILSTLQTFSQSPQLVSSASSLPELNPSALQSAHRARCGPGLGTVQRKEGKDGSAGKGIRIRWPVARSRNAGLF